MSAGLLIFRWVGGWIKHDAIKGDALPLRGTRGFFCPRFEASALPLGKDPRQ